MVINQPTYIESTRLGRVRKSYFEHDGEIVARLDCKSLSDGYITMCYKVLDDLDFMPVLERMILDALEVERAKDIPKHYDH